MGLPFNIGKFNLFTVGLPRDNVLAHSLLRLLNYNQGHLLGSHNPGSSLSPLHGCQVMFFFFQWIFPVLKPTYERESKKGS